MRLSSPSRIRETIGVVVSQCGACLCLSLRLASRFAGTLDGWVEQAMKVQQRDVLHFIRLFATLTRRRGVPNGMGRIEAQEPGSLSVFVRHSYDAHGYIYPLRRASSGIPSFLFQRLFNPLAVHRSSLLSYHRHIHSEQIQLSAAMFIYNVHTPSKTFALPYKGSSIVPLLFRAELMIRFHRG